MRALVSIHDVMPSTLDRVEDLLGRCARHGVDRITLLVVPGLDWTADGIDRLRRWEQAGHELAAHGWHHRAARRRTAFHRLHAAVISRDAAEHLSRSRREVRDLMRASHAWFAEHGLASPSLYVPPAWALGPIRSADLAELPYGHVETLYGLRTAAGTHRLSLTGYEADTAARALALRATNAAARALGGERPVRVGLHPDDARLRLAGDMDADLAAVTDARHYRDRAPSPRADHGRRPAERA